MNVTILAGSEYEAEMMEGVANTEKINVVGTNIWLGPVPDGSFTYISPMMRMSTPEYFFLRKANELPYMDAVMLGMELCGKYLTEATTPDLAESGDYDFLREPKTNREKIKRYLDQIADTKEGQKALEVLCAVRDNSCSPMASYLYTVLCTSERYGGIGLADADVSVVYECGTGFMPASHGDFIVYDLCWRDKKVAVQYVERGFLSYRNLDALETDGMDVILLSSPDYHSDYGFETFLNVVSHALGYGDVKVTDEIKSLKKPEYRHMKMTKADITNHI